MDMSLITYLDYAATNPYPQYHFSDYGYYAYFNSNANYAFGEKKFMRECEERVKTAIGANGGKVAFGGTASQLVENLFTHIAEETSDYLTVGSIYEHDAVFRFADEWCNINNLQLIIQKYKAYSQLIVCLMGVNNVTGRVMPIEEIGRLCKKHGAFFVCDMTAMIGHAPISANIDDWCDCAFWSGHKIGTELGIGAMWLSAKFNDWVGDFKLHGTPNVAGALSIAGATEDAVKNQKENCFAHWVDLYCMLKRYLEKSGIEYQAVCGDCAWGEWTPAIHAIRLNGINADALQQYLASKQIYVGLGASACAEAHDYRVLNAFGLSDEEASEVIRVSFGENSKSDDVLTLVEGIKEFKERFIR